VGHVATKAIENCRTSSTGMKNFWLVVQFHHLEKYESMGLGLSHILWKKTCLKPPMGLNGVGMTSLFYDMEHI